MRFIVPPDAKSWVPVSPDSHFPIQNLPFGLGCIDEDCENLVTRIGDHVVDLCALVAEGLLPEELFPAMHCFIDVDRNDLAQLRQLVFELLREDNPTLRDNAELRDVVLRPADQVEMLVPMEIPQFVDFYSGIHHASNVGKMFRPDQPPLLPNYRWVPVAYNGRASSVVPSGATIHRPLGQTMPAGADRPTYGPTRELDFELELGFFVAHGNDIGEAIPVGQAEDHMLGMVLVNDWSARDVQRFEYQPLGPFLAKSFATSISPWVVMWDALEPFRCAGIPQDPAPLDHLRTPNDGHFDIQLEVAIQTPRMTRPQVISRTSATCLYWCFRQQLAHLTSNGTPVEPGDLIASGTISGPEEGTFGSLLELTWRGSKPLRMEETGEERTFLEDGDRIIMTGYCQGDGYRVGFGQLENVIQG